MSKNALLIKEIKTFFTKLIGCAGDFKNMDPGFCNKTIREATKKEEDMVIR